MDEVSNRNLRQWERVAVLRLGHLTTHDLLTNLELIWRDDVALFSICILNKSNAACTIWIVLDRHDRRLYTELVALEVDNAVHTLVSTTAVTRCDTTSVVPSTRLLDRFEEALLWL